MSSNQNLGKKYGWAFKIAGGAGVIGLLYYFTPIVDLLYIFAILVVIPLTFLCAVGIMSDGTYEMFSKVPQTIRNFSSKVKEYRHEMHENPDVYEAA